MKPRVVYLCFQATQEGQASYAHVHEIIGNLERQGWSAELVEPSYKEPANLPGLLGRISAFIGAQRRLWTHASPRGSVLYVRNHVAALPTVLGAKLAGVPVVYEVNGTDADMFIAHPWTRRFASVLQWALYRQLRWADAVVAVTPQLGEWARREAGSKRIEIVPNGANTDLFHPNARSELALPERYAVFFGALARWQGIRTLLEAAEHPEWPEDVSLVVVGQGAEQDQVREAVARNPKVVYVGSLPYTEVGGVVARSLVGLCLKTNDQGHASAGLNPLKVFETLACDVPVIVTDFPGQADLVREHECGLVVPDQDPQAVARAVAYLREHPEERDSMGGRGGDAVRREHSWYKRAEQTGRLMQELLHERETQTRRATR